MRKVIISLSFFWFLVCHAQTAFIGDMFGGRLWYFPTNFSVGSYSAHTVCGDSNQLYSWGSNVHGELGFGNIPSQYLPVKVPGMNNINYYSAGYVAGAIKKDGTGWVWGKKLNKPTQVIDDVKYIDAGDKSVTFIKGDGTVWSVGENDYGCFGNGQGYSSDPVKMSGVDNAVRVANGSYTTTILLETGEVMTCGYNFYYGLGHSQKNVIVTEPTLVPGLKDIVAIASNRFVNIALDRKGDVFIWGYGHGNWNTQYTVRRLEEISNIVAISARNDGAHFMALDSAGNCYSWGHNYYAQLGTGNKKNVSVPTLVASDVIDILAGESFSYIIKKDWSVWCAGSNHGGSISLGNFWSSSQSFTKLSLENTGICNVKYANFTKKRIVNVSLCDGDTLIFGRQTVVAEGTYVDSFFSLVLDSIHTYNVSLIPRQTQSLQYTICGNENLVVNGVKYDSNGVFLDTLSNIFGCDSILKIKVKVLPISVTNQIVHVCPLGQVIVGNSTYSKQGLYFDTLTNILGCDSIVHTKVIEEKDYSFIDYKEICSYDSLRYQGVSHDKKGLYIYSFKTVWGCDSNYALDLDTVDYNKCFHGLTYVPNSFTPNGDLINDDFGFSFLNIINAELRIFNSWGELIFTASGTDPRWDGAGTKNHEPCKSGVYMYQLYTTALDSQSKKYQGTVSLLR